MTTMGLSDTSAEDPLYEVIDLPVHLPSLPALTTLTINLCTGEPSPRLTNILCGIPRTSALTSIAIRCKAWSSVKYHLQGRWVDIDRWLERVAGRGESQEGLSVMLNTWPQAMSVWEEFLRGFRKAGGKIRVEFRNSRGQIIREVK